MREDALEVLARNRTDLLKSISQNSDIEEEAGHYLTSVENVIRSEIEYQATPEDELCLKAATDVLKRRLSPDELVEFLDRTDRDIERTIPERKKRQKPDKNLSRLMASILTDHSWKDRIKSADDIGLAHGTWPGATERKGGYGTHHPFHKDIHPLRRQNTVTGRPMYESMLFEKYFGHDNTPWWEDDFHENLAEAPEEETFAKQVMRAEDAHEKHHRKLNSPIYLGVKKYNNDTGKEETTYPFFGGPKSKNAYSPYDHMETTRLHDYERWKEEEGTDMAALEEKFSGLSEENKERAMQMQHFKDRMDKMSLGGTTSTTVDPTEGMTDQEISDFVTEYGPDAAEPYLVRHSHSMGWDTLMKGLYFLKPEDRTRILQHISDHESDTEDKQLVTLSDGLEFPMTRLKRNLESNAGAEKHWFTRSHKSSAPNVPKTIEDLETDSKYKGKEGGMVNALREVQIPTLDEDGKVTGTKSAYATLLQRLNDGLNRGLDDEDKHFVSTLFPHDEHHQGKIRAFMETEDNPAKAVSAVADISPEAELDREGLLSLIGYDDDLNPVDPESHPSLPRSALDGTLLEKDVVERVLKEYQNKVSLGRQSKEIKNGYGPLRTGFNAPKSSNMPDGHDEHYIDMDGGKRGHSHLATKYFANAGGLGRDASTYGEFLHAHHTYGNDESLLGDMGEFSLNPRIGTTGLYGSLHITPLLPGYRVPMTPLQILSRHGVSRRDIDEKPIARSAHNNFTDELFTNFPELMDSLHTELPTADSHFQDIKFNRESAADFQQFHPYAGVGSIRGDTGLMNRSVHAHRLAYALGRMNDPTNPSARLVHTYEDLVNNPELAPDGINHGDYLLHQGDALKELPDVAASGLGRNFRRDTLNEMGDIRTRLEALETERLEAIKRGLPVPDRSAEKRVLRSDLDDLKARLEQHEMEELGKRSRNTQFSEDFSEKLNADMRASMQYAKEKLLPLIIKENPDAFNTGDPVTALANAMRLAYDASRGLLVDGSHTLSTVGYHEKEQTRESQEQTMARRGRASPHREVATSLNEGGVELKPGMSVKQAMKLLEMPDAELGDDKNPYVVQVQKVLDSLTGPTKAATFGQIMRMGKNIANRDFSSYKDIDRPMREHIADFEEHPYSRASIPLNRGVPEYGALMLLNHIGSDAFREKGDLTAYGLDMFPHPLPPKRTGKKGQLWESSQKSKAYHQAMSNHVFTFDEGQSGPLEEASAGSVTKPVHGKMDVPIRPVHELSGNVATSLFNSGRMDWGYSMSPSIGVEYDSRGQPMVGTNMPQDMLLNSVPMPWLNYVFGEEWVNQLYSNDFSNLIETLQNNQTNPADGRRPIDDLNNVGKMLKADLPKELPLIDPLHRIFELEDMEQLRGFTGEWVVSKYHEGTRVKVKKKGGRVDITNEDGDKVGVDDSMRSALRKVCDRDYVIDGTIVDDELHINDIMLYEETDVTDLTTRERVKLIRGQFDSHEPVHVPSPESIRVTDEVGFEEAVKDLGGDGQKLLLRDAKSTYMKGEERHPKWVLLAKSNEDIHIPFAMEMDRGHFVIHLPEDLVKYEIVDNEPVNPIAAIGSITKSDYSLRLASSLEPYWRRGFEEMLKEELETKNVDEADWDEDKADEGMTDERAHRIQEQSAGLLKPKKDKNLLLKPKETLKALLTMERILDKLEKQHYPMSGGRALGIDVGSDIASPRGPTMLTSEHAVPDWDMKERPEEDPEKPSDYPKKPRRKEKNEEQYNDLEQ